MSVVQTGLRKTKDAELKALERPCGGYMIVASGVHKLEALAEYRLEAFRIMSRHCQAAAFLRAVRGESTDDGMTAGT